MNYLLIAFLSLSLIFTSPAAAKKRDYIEKKGTVTVLSIDGGGVRGIVPTLILQDIERRMGIDHISNAFDVMGGTSTGALIALMLNIKQLDSDEPKYNLGDVKRFYETLAKKVFTRSYYQYWRTLAGWTGAKYESTEFEKHLLHYMNGALLSDTYKDIIVPSYNMRTRRMRFFKSSHARKFEQKDFLLRNVARATSAAPSYFEAVRFKNTLDTSPGVYIDGGIGANNPTLSTLIYASELYGKKKDFFVLSLGCGTPYDSLSDNLEDMKVDISKMGKLDWASQIVDVLMDGTNDVTHYQVKSILGPLNYYRIQLHLPEEVMKMDDGSSENIGKLKEITQLFIADNSSLLDKISKKLNSIIENNAGREG